MQTKICTRCNIEKELTEFYKHTRSKYGVDSICKSCVAEKGKQYRQDNPKKIAEHKKHYQQTHAKRISEHKRQYRIDNADQITEYVKQYRQDNPKKIAEIRKQWCQTPKGKALIKAASHNRRARKLQNGGKHTGKEILQLFDLQSGVCPYCQTKLYKSGKNKYHIDHIVPLSKGGTNDISNIQLLCPHCNLTKKDKLPEEFAQQHGKLL